jgi:arylsulfatase A-like enzyme
MPTQPNILLITSDQQHFNTLGFANPRIKTPNLDRLARRGMNFTRAYTNSPVCTPSRATIITGQYPAWHGAWTIGVKLSEDVPTVGQIFIDHGYDTTLVGKAHFQPLQSSPGPGGESVERQPTLRDLDFWRNFEQTHCPWYGFQHVETCRNHADESHVGGHYALWMEQQGLKNWADYYRPAGRDADPTTHRHHSWDLPEQYHYTPWTAQRSIAHMDRCHKEQKPFFLWSSFHDPHPPYLVPEPWASMYDPADMPIGRLAPHELETMSPLLQETQKQNPDFSDWQDEDGYANHGFQSHLHDEAQLRKDMAIYYGMTSFMDHHIGKMLDKLDELGIADNTLIVFTTDHGHFLGQHGLIAKAFMYDDNLRLPFLAQWPGKIPAGSSTDALQSLVDLAPTFLSAAGIPTPGQMQGVNQLPVWTGEQKAARTDVIAEHRHQTHRFTARSYITDRYKLTLYKDRDWGELFDLQKDPNEIHNRWNDPAYDSVKMTLYHAFLQAEMRREPTRMPRVAGA